MVGFISEPAIKEENDAIAAPPKAKISGDDFSAPIDSGIGDVYLGDDFLDFDSINEYFELFPEDAPAVHHHPGELFVSDFMETKPFSDGFELVSGSVGLGEADGAKIDAFPCFAENGTAGDDLVEKSFDFAGARERDGSVIGAKVSDDADDDSDSESSSESSSSSSSSSSGSSSDECDSDAGDKVVHIKEMKVTDDDGEMEEGEIREVNQEEKPVRENVDDDAEIIDGMVGWSDVEDDDDAVGVGGGPIKSKNELQALPPVPPVEVKLEPNHHLSPVGVVLSVLGAQVIVEGVEKHTPLNEGSILWITESRAPLGYIDEIFGPVKNPYYMVRYNTEDEVPSEISQGSSISFVPEFASHILNEKDLCQKGYDASGENDEELTDEAEFSDDQEEVEYRRKRMGKRGSTDSSDPKGVNKKNFGKKGKARERSWKKNNKDGGPSQMQTPLNSNPRNQNNNGSASSSSILSPSVGGSVMMPTFVPPPQQPGSSVPSVPNGVWMNGNFPPQPQIDAGLANGLANLIQWAAQGNQFPFQMPMPNPMLPPNMVLPNFGQPNALGGPPFGQWPGPFAQNMGNNQAFGMGFNQGPPFNGGMQGFQHNMPQVVPSAAPPSFSEAPGMFNPRAGGMQSFQPNVPPVNQSAGPQGFSEAPGIFNPGAGGMQGFQSDIPQVDQSAGPPGFSEAPGVFNPGAGGVQSFQSNAPQVDPSARPPGFSGVSGTGNFNPGAAFGRGGKPPMNHRGRFSGKRGRGRFK